MEWFPFELGEGEALSLDIDIGNPDLDTPEIQIARYDDGGELIAAVTVDDIVEAAAQPPADTSAGAAQPTDIADPLDALDAVFDGDADPIWVGFDNAVPTSAPSAPTEMANDGAVSLFEDTVVIADADAVADTDGDTAVDAPVAAAAPAETLNLADVFGADSGDVPQALQLENSALEPADAVSTANSVLGESDSGQGVVVVLGGEDSGDLYYIDYII